MASEFRSTTCFVFILWYRLHPLYMLHLLIPHLAKVVFTIGHRYFSYRQKFQLDPTPCLQLKFWPGALSSFLNFSRCLWPYSLYLFKEIFFQIALFTWIVDMLIKFRSVVLISSWYFNTDEDIDCSDNQAYPPSFALCEIASYLPDVFNRFDILISSE